MMVQANGAFIDGSFQALEKYENDLRRHFDVQFQEVNFGDAAEAARTINAWIARDTNRKIESVVDPSQISNGLVLANAVYFKSKSFLIYKGTV